LVRLIIIKIFEEMIMKLRGIAKIVCVLFIVGLFSTMAVAGDGGNPRKGKYLWKKNCKTCHVEGQEGGKLSPSSKTQNQWNKFFEGDSHAPMIEEKCMKYSESDLHDIQHYMEGHAMDSDQPETCS